MVGGKFGDYCHECVAAAARGNSPLSAAWKRDRDYEDHRADTVQALDDRGKPNGEFIRLYPEESKELFTKEEIEQYG